MAALSFSCIFSFIQPLCYGIKPGFADCRGEVAMQEAEQKAETPPAHPHTLFGVPLPCCEQSKFHRVSATVQVAMTAPRRNWVRPAAARRGRAVVAWSSPPSSRSRGLPVLASYLAAFLPWVLGGNKGVVSQGVNQVVAWPPFSTLCA